MYSDLKQKETLQASLSVQNRKLTICFFIDLEKEEYINLFPGLHLIPLSYECQGVSFPGDKQLCRTYHILLLVPILPLFLYMVPVKNSNCFSPLKIDEFLYFFSGPHEIIFSSDFQRVKFSGDKQLLRNYYR